MIEPNYQSIVITNAIGLALLICLTVSSHLTRGRRHLDDRMFAALVAVVAVECVFEPISWFVNGIAQPWAFTLNFTANTIAYLGSCVSPYLWVLYVDLRLHKGTERIRNWHPAALVPVAVIAVLNISNPVTHLMFTIDSANVYNRQPLSYLTYLVMFWLFAYSGWLKRKFQHKHGKIHFLPIGMFLAPVVAGATIQALFFGISLAWPSACVGLVSIHMSLQNELSYIDSLTNLYNRACLDATLEKLERGGKGFYGVMADLDHFKGINDTFGHSEGDKALVQTARILVEASGEAATVFRYAGDEFVILLVDAGEEHAERVKRSISEAIATFNETSGAPYQLSISMGGSPFTPGNDSIDGLLHRIDNRMYEQKRLHHQLA